MTGANMLSLLESRLDNAVFTLAADSRSPTRQLVNMVTSVNGVNQHSLIPPASRRPR
jgi:ribosomal protein S4